MAVFRKITDLRAGAAFLRFIRYIRRSFPVHMACPYHRRGFLVPNIPSVPQKPVLSTVRIFRTGGGLLRYGMQPDMLNRDEL